MVKFQILLKKNNENVTRKKSKKAQTMTVELNKAKTTTIHPRQKKTKTSRTENGGKQFKVVVIGKI